MMLDVPYWMRRRIIEKRSDQFKKLILERYNLISHAEYSSNWNLSKIHGDT